jgi:hypothetical protein
LRAALPRPSSPVEPQGSKAHAFRRESMGSSKQGVLCYRNAPSYSVHARVRCLQAIHREQARFDRQHRPAARRDPELLPVSRATELLGRSACSPRCECPTRPHHRQQVLQATDCGVGSQIAATDPVPPFVVVNTSKIFVMRALYERGTCPHNI